jgi:hypothetical protein
LFRTVRLYKEERRDEFEDRLQAQEPSEFRTDERDSCLPVGHLVHNFQVHAHDADEEPSFDYDADIIWQFLATTLPLMPQLRDLSLTHPHVVPECLSSLKEMHYLRALSITIGDDAEGIITFLNQLTQLTDLSINLLGRKHWRLWPSNYEPSEPPLAMPNLRKLRWREDEFNVCDTMDGDQTFHFLGACHIHPMAAIDIEIRYVEDSQVSDMLPFFRAHQLSEARLNFDKEFDLSPIVKELMRLPVLHLTAHFPNPREFFQTRQLPATLHLRVLSDDSSGSYDDLLELLEILTENDRPVQSTPTRLHLWYDNTYDDYIETAKLDYEQQFEEYTSKLAALGIDVICEGPVDAAELALSYVRTRC